MVEFRTDPSAIDQEKRRKPGKSCVDKHDKVVIYPSGCENKQDIGQL